MKLDYKKTFYVGLAFLLISLFWRTYDLIIAKILIDDFGLNQTWSGVVMSLDNVIAVILIPIFGALSDKKNSKRGKRTPYIIIGTVIAAFVFMSLTFSDNYQRAKLETETTIVEDYNEFYEGLDDDGELTYAEWVAVRDAIVADWDGLLSEGSVTQADYDDFYELVIDGDDSTDREGNESDQREGMDEILAVSGGELDKFDNTDLKDLYYRNLSERAWIITSTSPFTFIIFMLTLLVALLAMATFRSPAVALMPDVTIKPLRSKGNAVINLMGTVGGIVATVILMVFGLSELSYVNYAPAFITVGVLMLVILAIFLWKVKEPKLAKEKEELEAKLGLVEEETEEEKDTETKLSKPKRNSLILILVSVALWFTGYNAVMSKLSDYAPKVLNMEYGMPIIIAQMAALIAFIPIGILATKIGRKKTILIGIIMLTVCFGSVYFLTVSTASILYVIFALTGIAWATINVNSYPMVVELAKGSDVGKYTGYYYTFSMSAQILTPILSGFLMDTFQRTILFPYATIFVFASFITMFFVKHGDSKVDKKGSALESFDVDMD